jgi:lia operon protein LiaG
VKLNIKKIVIGLTVFMLACFITAGAILAVMGNLAIKLEKVDESKSFKPEEINKISIDITSTDIDIISTDEDEITVHFYGEVSTNRDTELPALIAYKTGSELRIEIEKPRIIMVGINIWRAKLDVYVPEDLIETLKVDTVSSDTRMSNLSIKKIIVNTVSGDFKGEALVADGFKLNTTSGDIEINDYKGEVKIGSVSGDVVLGNGDGDDDIEVSTISGNVYVEREDLGNISIETISGEVAVNLSRDAQFYFRANSVSGDIENKFPVEIISSGRTGLEGVAGSDEKEIIVSTTSGDISIGYK